MRTLVFICLTACAASQKQQARPQAAAENPSPASATSMDPQAPGAPPPLAGVSCVSSLKIERALPDTAQLALAHDRALLTALGQCERYLIERGGKKLKTATGDSVALYNVSIDALADLPEPEVHSYIALLNRFALIGDLRRQLYYSPRLRPWFEQIAQQKACSDPVREAWLFFSSTPESLGGNTTLGAALAARCP